MNILNIPLSSQ